MFRYRPIRQPHNLKLSQISQGAEIMGQVVPIVIHLMMNDYQRVWGEACYPVVD
jgi:hypothetical protein